ncbi:Telomere-binding protein cav [Bienertia sinuspersici]
MEGFFRRVWKEYVVDKVITIKKGMFLIRFKSMELRDKLMLWIHLDMDITRDEIKRIPIWIHLDLNFKYWDTICLKEIVKLVGTLIKVDNTTAQREKLHYARCMVEVEVDQQFPKAVHFYDLSFCI